MLSSRLNVISYSGYLTIDDAKQPNLFFWFFPAQEKPESSPVLLWLKDYPGFTSLKGLFLENGPFMVDESLTLRKKDQLAGRESVLCCTSTFRLDQVSALLRIKTKLTIQPSGKNKRKSTKLSRS
ncbi:unnamed protein product, partial [Allacma fusca]